MANPQNNPKRLPAKIEQHNGKWEKITVRIPDSSYILNEVKYENNKLSILFVYTANSPGEPANFSFMLSAFGINANTISENDQFLVAGSVSGSLEPSQESAMMAAIPEGEQSLADFKCPPKCDLDY